MDAPERHPYLEKLTGGDRRSIGSADQVVEEALADPGLVPVLVSGLQDHDPVVRMRSADALEKVSAHQPAWLQPFKDMLLGEIGLHPQKEVRWHVAQMLPRLSLDHRERVAAFRLLLGYLKDASRIVQANALEGLVNIAEGEPALEAEMIPLLEENAQSDSPAVSSRSRKLLDRLGR